MMHPHGSKVLGISMQTDNATLHKRAKVFSRRPIDIHHHVIAVGLSHHGGGDQSLTIHPVQNETSPPLVVGFAQQGGK